MVNAGLESRAVLQLRRNVAEDCHIINAAPGCHSVFIKEGL